MPDPAGALRAARPGLGPWRAGLATGFTPFPDHLVGSSAAACFLEVAERFPGSEALHSPAGSWTYRELRDAASKLAASTSAAVGTDAPAPVAILATHDGPLVVAMLGILLAEHIVVVLDPAAPPAQQLHAVVEGGVQLVLHDAAHADAARALAEAAPGLDRCSIEDALEGEAAPIPVPTGGADHPIMLAFTSGTSGVPKAGIITNGVLVNLIRGATNALGIGPDDRMPMLFPTSLAVASYPMFLPLLNGGTLATLDVRSVGLGPLADFLADERITLAYMAPTVVRFLVDALAGRTFPDLRMIALGGELVDAEVVALTADLLGPTHIANGFGTTETGVITLYILDPDEQVTGAVPAGYPVPDVELAIVDDEGTEVAPGHTGEVVVASPHLFAGYRGHPELTAQVLEPDPLGRPGWARYRTGDLGRLDEHGALTVLGRLDTKAKVRGRFVVLGDVEALLHDLPEIGDAAVTAVTTDGVTDLVAVVAPSGEGVLDPAALRAHLLASHEAYRVPSRWIVVDHLPQLPNGKLDRRAVAQLEAADQPSTPAANPVTATPSGAADRTQLEQQLTAIWAELLPVGTVGLDDDFEHLGGHSLLAAQMLVHVEQRLGVMVPMSTLVRSRTVRALADAIDAIRSSHRRVPSTVAMVQAGDERTRPRLWFVHDLPGSAYRVRHLAEHLGPDQPVWSFESPFLRGEPNPFTRLDTFVANYLRDLREAQPSGPYWLAGYSFGGICAYEMARQLTADGEEVAFVGVIDVGPGYRGPNWTDRHSPPWPYFGVPHPPAPDAPAAVVARHYLDMATTTPKGFARHLSLLTGIARPVDNVRFAADLRRQGRVRPEWRLWYAWEEHWKLASKAWNRTYAYAGEVHLFWASLTGATDGTMGWGPQVGELHIHRFEGFHDDILEPKGAPAAAAALRSVLDQQIIRRTAPEDRP